MSTQNEYTGTDIGEAITQACNSLNVSQEQLNIQVISTGSAGILGLFRKKAIIHASLKDDQVPTPKRSTHHSSKARRDNNRNKTAVYFIGLNNT